MEEFQMKEIWQLNAMPDPELDTGPEERKFFSFAIKGISGTLGEIWIRYVD